MAEVEDAIHRLPGIERAVVKCVQNESREPALVAFLVTETGHAWSSEKLMRVALRDLLPDFMIPSAIVKLECFPLTPTKCGHLMVDAVGIEPTTSPV
jgi:fengycin family lipopeptide synthetase D